MIFDVILWILVVVILVINLLALLKLEKLLDKSNWFFSLRNLFILLVLTWVLWFWFSYVANSWTVLENILFYVFLVVLAIFLIYIVYILVKWACLPGWWVILYRLPLVGLIVCIYILYRLAKNFGFSWWWTILLFLFYKLTFPYVILKWEYQNCRPFWQVDESKLAEWKNE